MNKQAKKLEKEIISAVSQKIPVNFSRFKHRWIVDALHSLVFNSSNFPDAESRIRVTFEDGSETRPFPIGGFTLSLPPVVSLPVVKVGLNSGRHPEMDRFVDLYLFRNAELSEFRSIAEQEEYAFHQGKIFLQNPRWLPGGVIEMHQTGLEPLIVGFYRAVVTVSLERKKKGLPPIIVQPRSWSPSFFSLRRYLAFRLPKNIALEEIITHMNNSGTVLKKMIKEFPGFFSILEQPDDLILKWVPERPMWQTEKDILFSRFGRMKNIWQPIYAASQFMEHSHWGYNI